MGESKHERIIEALTEELESIRSDDGETYWYTPDAVVQPSYFSEERVFKNGKAVFYCLLEDDEETDEDVSGGVTRHARLDLLLAAQYKHEDSDPFKRVTLRRRTVQNRLARDVETKIREMGGAGQGFLGKLADNVEVILIDRSPDRTFKDGWATVWVRLLITYDARYEDP